MGATVKEANEERTERENRIPEMIPDGDDGIGGNEVDSSLNETIAEFDRCPAKPSPNSDENPAVAEDTVFESVLGTICFW
mmetsp:Transcript_188/g.467  ORF Transcript_188/g.467 Transcript_188/m.467 type:complete len:80 (-) Transcript_188:124-363(-)